MDIEAIKRGTKRVSMILLMEDLKLIAYREIEEGKADGLNPYEFLKQLVAKHEQTFLVHMEKLAEAQEAQLKASGNIPNDTKIN